MFNLIWQCGKIRQICAFPPCLLWIKLSQACHYKLRDPAIFLSQPPLKWVSDFVMATTYSADGIRISWVIGGECINHSLLTYNGSPTGPHPSHTLLRRCGCIASGVLGFGLHVMCALRSHFLYGGHSCHYLTALKSISLTNCVFSVPFSLDILQV